MRILTKIDENDGFDSLDISQTTQMVCPNCTRPVEMVIPLNAIDYETVYKELEKRHLSIMRENHDLKKEIKYEKEMYRYAHNKMCDALLETKLIRNKHIK